MHKAPGSTSDPAATCDWFTNRSGSSPFRESTPRGTNSHGVGDGIASWRVSTMLTTAEALKGGVLVGVRSGMVGSGFLIDDIQDVKFVDAVGMHIDGHRIRTKWGGRCRCEPTPWQCSQGMRWRYCTFRRCGPSIVFVRRSWWRRWRVVQTLLRSRGWWGR